MPNPATILLVDDEEAVQKLLTYPLERDGYRVVSPHATATRRSERFGEQPVDLVVLDLALPHPRRPRGLQAAPCYEPTCRSSSSRRATMRWTRCWARARRRRLHHEAVLDSGVPEPRQAALRRASAPSTTRTSRSRSRSTASSIDPARRAVDSTATAVELTYVEFELLSRSCPARGGFTVGGRCSRRSGGLRLPRPADDRRPRAASAREARVDPSDPSSS